MNKELIKKYKAEFDHWLNGGTIVTLFTGAGWQIQQEAFSTFNWKNPEFIESIVINDEYVEFRKALTEGKTVQYNRRNEHRSAYDDWMNWVYGQSFGNVPIEFFRINSKELKFKVGDWVKHTDSNTIYHVKGFSTHGQTKGFIQVLDEYNLVPNSECELWSPKPNEWCVFWRTGITEYIVSKFNYRRDCGAYITEYGHEFYNIAPLEFINTLKD